MGLLVSIIQIVYQLGTVTRVYTMRVMIEMRKALLSNGYRSVRDFAIRNGFSCNSVDKTIRRAAIRGSLPCGEVGKAIVESLDKQIGFNLSSELKK